MTRSGFLTTVLLLLLLSGCETSSVIIPDSRLDRYIENIYENNELRTKPTNAIKIRNLLAKADTAISIVDSIRAFDPDIRDTATAHSIYLFSASKFYSANLDPSLEPDGLAIFGNPVEFHNCTFSSYDSLFRFSPINSTWFNQAVQLANCKFKNLLQFSRCRFRDSLSILAPNDSLSNNLMFNKCEINNLLFFKSEAKAGEDDDVLNTRKTILRNAIYFNNCSFKGTLDLSFCRFIDKGNLIFHNSTLPDTLILRNTEFEEVLDLTSAITSGSQSCQLIVQNIDFSKIRFRYDQIHLFFPDSTLKNPRDRERISSIYESMLNNLKVNGFMPSYKKLDIEYRNWQSSFDLTTMVSRFWWQYGYNKFRVFYWTLGLLTFFALLNTFFYDGLIATYEVKKLESSNFHFSPNFLIKGFQYFGLSMIFTLHIFFKLALDFEKLHFKRHWLLILLFIEYGIGLICTGYLINWIIDK